MSLFRGHRVVQEQLFARLDSLLVVPFAVADLASVVREVSVCAKLWCVHCVGMLCIPCVGVRYIPCVDMWCVPYYTPYSTISAHYSLPFKVFTNYHELCVKAKESHVEQIFRLVVTTKDPNGQAELLQALKAMTITRVSTTRFAESCN